jgi:hypothetical protein
MWNAKFAVFGFHFYDIFLVSLFKKTIFVTKIYYNEKDFPIYPTRVRIEFLQ